MTACLSEGHTRLVIVDARYCDSSFAHAYTGIPQFRCLSDSTWIPLRCCSQVPGTQYRCEVRVGVPNAIRRRSHPCVPRLESPGRMEWLRAVSIAVVARPSNRVERATNDI